MGILPNLATGSRVALVRLRSMGDCVLTTPAIRLLKQYRPDLEVGVVVEDRFRDVYAGNPDVTQLLTPARSSLLTWRPKLCLNLHGGTRSVWITALSLARWRAGFGHYRFQSIYNLHIPRAQQVLGEERTVHTAEHVASAMFYLGVPRAEIPAACLYATPISRTSAYCVIHPQATAPEKIWPAERFLSLANEIKEQYGLEPVFIGANRDEVTPFAHFATVAGAPLKEVMGLIAGANLFVGNDSGPAHLAAGFGRPGVVLFGGSDPVVWAPWRCPGLRQIISSPVAQIPVSLVLNTLKDAYFSSQEGVQ